MLFCVCCFDKHGVVVKETSRRGRREPAGFPVYQPQPPPPSLLSDKKGFAGRPRGLGRKGISSLSPHTTAHVMLSLDQRCSPRIRFAAVCIYPVLTSWKSNLGSKPKPHKPRATLQPGSASQLCLLLQSKRLKPFGHLFPRNRIRT